MMIEYDLTPKLALLKEQGCIMDFKLETNVGEDGGPCRMRCTDNLDLLFSNGQILKLGTFCSGSAENTSLIIRE